MRINLNLKNAINMVKMLSVVEKVKLIRYLTAQVESELARQQCVPRKSLRGLWRGLDISEQEINSVRAEIWGSFPLISRIKKYGYLM